MTISSQNHTETKKSQSSEQHDVCYFAIESLIGATADGTIGVGDLLFMKEGLVFILYDSLPIPKRPSAGLEALAFLIGGAPGAISYLWGEQQNQDQLVSRSMKIALNCRILEWGLPVQERMKRHNHVLLIRESLQKVNFSEKGIAFKCSEKRLFFKYTGFINSHRSKEVRKYVKGKNINVLEKIQTRYGFNYCHIISPYDALMDILNDKLDTDIENQLAGATDDKFYMKSFWKIFNILDDRQKIEILRKLYKNNKFYSTNIQISFAKFLNSIRRRIFIHAFAAISIISFAIIFIMLDRIGSLSSLKSWGCSAFPLSLYVLGPTAILGALIFSFFGINEYIRIRKYRQAISK